MKLSERQKRVLGIAFWNKNVRSGDFAEGRGANTRQTIDSLLRLELIEVETPGYQIYVLTEKGRKEYFDSHPHLKED